MFDPSIVYEDELGVHLGQELLDILSKNSFDVNPDKVILRYKNFRQEVTGLTVNKFPNLRRDYIRQLRAILHSCDKYGIVNAAKTYIKKGYCKNPIITAKVDCADTEDAIFDWFQRVIIGKVLYVRQIKGATSLTYLSFAAQVNTVFDNTVFDVSELHFFDNLIRANTFVLQCDDGDSYVQGSAFLVPELGLFTSSHVTEDGGFFKVYSVQNYPHNHLGIVGKEMNEISADRSIDYALYHLPIPSDDGLSFQLGDSKKLKIGDQVTIIGYPKHQAGNSPYIQTCSITSEKEYLGAPFFTVSGRIVHGASGGVVLNLKYEVVGIIKGGIETLSEDDKNENQGFVPIHLVMEHIRSKADF